MVLFKVEAKPELDGRHGIVQASPAKVPNNRLPSLHSFPKSLSLVHLLLLVEVAYNQCISSH